MSTREDKYKTKGYEYQPIDQAENIANKRRICDQSPGCLKSFILSTSYKAVPWLVVLGLTLKCSPLAPTATSNSMQNLLVIFRPAGSVPRRETLGDFN